MTTDTDHEFEDIIGEIYVERETSFLYEVKFFDDFVLVRPASPAFYAAMRKLSHVEFANEFDDYNGDPCEVLDFIRGNLPELVLE